MLITITQNYKPVITKVIIIFYNYYANNVLDFFIYLHLYNLLIIDRINNIEIVIAIIFFITLLRIL